MRMRGLQRRRRRGLQRRRRRGLQRRRRRALQRRRRRALQRRRRRALQSVTGVRQRSSMRYGTISTGEAQERWLSLSTRAQQTEFINANIQRSGGKLVPKEELLCTWKQSAIKKAKNKKGEEMNGYVLAEAIGKVGSLDALQSAIRSGAVTRTVVKGLEVSLG